MDRAERSSTISVEPEFLNRGTDKQLSSSLTRHTSSIATVSEIPPGTLPGGDFAINLFEKSAGRWHTDWVDQYPKTNLNRAFSDSKKFRFMNVLSAFIESVDGKKIFAGDFLAAGPKGEKHLNMQYE